MGALPGKKKIKFDTRGVLLLGISTLFMKKKKNTKKTHKLIQDSQREYAPCIKSRPKKI